MTPNIKTVIENIQTLRFLPESERTEYYDSVIAPQIKQAANDVMTRGGADSLIKWLEIQSAAYGLAVEGISEVTYKLNQQAPQELQQTISSLSLEQQIRIQMLLKEFSGEENLPAEIAAADHLRTSNFLNNTVIPIQPGQTVAASGVLGKFIGTSRFNSSRGFPVIHGTFTLFESDGTEVDNYTVNSGGGAQTFRTTNGPIPPGVYRVSNHRRNRTTPGMVLEGVGYSFDLDPANGTQVYGRSLFRIHPDGNALGTNGCLGVRENTRRLRDCENAIINLLERNGTFKISINY